MTCYAALCQWYCVGKLVDSVNAAMHAARSIVSLREDFEGVLDSPKDRRQDVDG